MIICKKNHALVELQCLIFVILGGQMMSGGGLNPSKNSLMQDVKMPGIRQNHPSNTRPSSANSAPGQVCSKIVKLLILL